jgi:hypothetical protein
MECQWWYSKFKPRPEEISHISLFWFLLLACDQDPTSLLDDESLLPPWLEASQLPENSQPLAMWVRSSWIKQPQLICHQTVDHMSKPSQALLSQAQSSRTIQMTCRFVCNSKCILLQATELGSSWYLKIPIYIPEFPSSSSMCGRKLSCHANWLMFTGLIRGSVPLLGHGEPQDKDRLVSQAQNKEQ